MKFIKLLLHAFVLIAEWYEDSQRRKKAREAEREQNQIRDNVADNLRDRGWLRDNVQDSGVSPQSGDASTAESGDRVRESDSN